MNNIAMSPHNAAIFGLFGRESVATQQYNQQRQEEFNASCPMLPGMSEFIERNKQRFHDFTKGATARRIQAVYHKTVNLFQEDAIRTILTLGEMQQSPAEMQRWVMAEPSVREAFLNNMCNGYENTYINPQASGVGVKQYDYRVATNGMMITEEVEEGTRTYAKTFFEKKKEDYKVSFNERVSIKQTMMAAALFMEEGINDPTSDLNELL